MKEIKRLRYVRHADKKGAYIPQNELNKTRQLTWLSQIGYASSLFYGPIFRTLQTLLAISCGLNGKVGMCSEVIEEIGPLSIEQEIGTDNFITEVKSGISNLEALDKVFSPEQVLKWESFFGDGVKKMLNFLPTNGFGIAVGHDPMIPLAARHFGAAHVQSIRPLEFIDFVLYEDGSIKPEVFLI